MRLPLLAQILLLVVVIVLTFGRASGFPVTIGMATGESMVPSIEPGDLLIGVMGEFEVGDVVMVHLSPIQWIAHRVVEKGEGYVITKGDNNPLPDPPVDRERVKYKVVAVTPREGWIIPALLVIASLMLPARTAGGVSPTDLAAIVLFPLILFGFLWAGSLQIPPPNPWQAVEPPIVEIVDISFSRDGSVVYLEYEAVNAVIEEVVACNFTVAGATFQCDGISIGGIVEVFIPREAYILAFNASDGDLIEAELSLEVALRAGKAGIPWILRGEYTLPINWRPLDVGVVEEGFVVTNPNFIPFTLKGSKLICITGEATIVSELGDITVPAGSSRFIHVRDECTTAYLEFSYDYGLPPHEGVVFERVKFSRGQG